MNDLMEIILRILIVFCIYHFLSRCDDKVICGYTDAYTDLLRTVYWVSFIVMACGHTVLIAQALDRMVF